MKKALILILVLVVVALAAGYYLTQMREQRPQTQEAKTAETSGFIAPRPVLPNYLPDNTVLYIGFSGLKGVKELIVQSPYYEKVTKSPFWSAYIAPQLSQIESGFEMQMGSHAADGETESNLPSDFDELVPIIWGLLGEEIAIAFGPDGDSSSDWHFNFLAKVSNKQNMEKLWTLVQEGTKMALMQESEVEFAGKQIHKFSQPGSNKETYVCQLDEVFALTVEIESMKSIINLHDSKAQGSFADTEHYKAITSKLKPGHFGEFFFDMGTDLGGMLSSLASVDGMALSTQPNQVFKTEGYAASRLYIKDGIVVESYSRVDPEKTDQKLVSFYKFEPNDLPLLSAVPENSIAALAMNCLDAKTIYEVAVDSASAQNPMAAVLISGYLAELEKKTGISVTEDLLPAIGPDIAVYFKGMDFTQAMSLPEFGFACSSSAPDKLLKAFPKIGDYILSFAEDKAPKPEHVKGEYKGHDVHELKIAMPVGKISLAAAVVDKYFCIGFGSSQLHAMLDCLSGEGEQLREQDLYEFISKDFPKKSNQVMFVDFKTVKEQLRVAFDRYADKGPDAKNISEALDFVQLLLEPVKVSFTTSIYEDSCVQRSYGVTRIEAE